MQLGLNRAISHTCEVDKPREKNWRGPNGVIVRQRPAPNDSILDGVRVLSVSNPSSPAHTGATAAPSLH